MKISRGIIRSPRPVKVGRKRESLPVSIMHLHPNIRKDVAMHLDPEEGKVIRRKINAHMKAIYIKLTKAGKHSNPYKNPRHWKISCFMVLSLQREVCICHYSKGKNDVQGHNRGCEGSYCKFYQLNKFVNVLPFM